MGWFSNAINSVSNLFSGARQSVSDLADKIQSGIQSAQKYAPQVEGALQKIGVGG